MVSELTNPYQSVVHYQPYMMTSSNGNIFPVTGLLCGEFAGHRWIPLTQRLVTRSFDVLFNLRLNQQLSKQLWRRWFKTPSPPLWRHCDGYTSVRSDPIRGILTAIICPLQQELQTGTIAVNGIVLPGVTEMSFWRHFRHWLHRKFSSGAASGDKVVGEVTFAFQCIRYLE